MIEVVAGNLYCVDFEALDSSGLSDGELNMIRQMVLCGFGRVCVDVVYGDSVRI